MRMLKTQAVAASSLLLAALIGCSGGGRQSRPVSEMLAWTFAAC